MESLRSWLKRFVTLVSKTFLLSPTILVLILMDWPFFFPTSRFASLSSLAFGFRRPGECCTWAFDRFIRYVYPFVQIKLFRKEVSSQYMAGDVGIELIPQVCLWAFLPLLLHYSVWLYHISVKQQQHFCRYVVGRIDKARIYRIRVLLLSVSVLAELAFPLSTLPLLSEPWSRREASPSAMTPRAMWSRSPR